MNASLEIQEFLQTELSSQQNVSCSRLPHAKQVHVQFILFTNLLLFTFNVPVNITLNIQTCHRAIVFQDTWKFRNSYTDRNCQVRKMSVAQLLAQRN